MFIERLTGTIVASLPSSVILDVQGVGYGLELPLSTLCQLPPIGQKLSLWVSSYIREDAVRLFGFKSFEDRQTFEVLLSLSGVGPKVALAILSTLTLKALERAVSHQETQILESVPGVGPRLAEKIIVELKPKIPKLKAAQHQLPHVPSERLDATKFDEYLPGFDPEDRREARESLFTDLESALENLGYKEKVIQPLIFELKSHQEIEDFPSLMRLALKRLSQGLLKDDAKSKKSNKQEKTPLPLDPHSVF